MFCPGPAAVNIMVFHEIFEVSENNDFWLCSQRIGTTTESQSLKLRLTALVLKVDTANEKDDITEV